MTSNAPDDATAYPYRWAAFDSLPREVRRAMWETAFPWCPVQAKDRLRKRLAYQPPDKAVQRVVDQLKRADLDRVRRDNPNYPGGVQRYEGHR